jgi:hypothetical protein
MPKFVGVMLVTATCGHLLEVFVTFLLHGKEFIAYPVLIAGMIGEFSFCFWLLFRGFDMEKNLI